LPAARCRHVTRAPRRNAEGSGRRKRVSARHQVKRLDRISEELALSNRSGRRNRFSSFGAGILNCSQFHRGQKPGLKSGPDVFADALVPLGRARPPECPAFAGALREPAHQALGTEVFQVHFIIHKRRLSGSACRAGSGAFRWPTRLELEHDVFWLIDLAADALHLSRLRGRSARSAGGGSLHSGSVARGDTPTPALPRKRERERTFFVVAVKLNFIILSCMAAELRDAWSSAGTVNAPIG
jgi:hypothetical protein